MITEDAVEFAAALPPIGGLLGLDLGTKTIGVATSDPDRRIASPVKTLKRGKFTVGLAELRELINERQTSGLVMGLPINMDGTSGPRAQSSRTFGRNLSRELDLPVLLWDERLSTAAVERELISIDTSRRRRAEVIDAMAANFILQGALDRLQGI
ncbi:Holliday junction resolvase RuvX [Pyruvatibacter sp. HU-CL02332]|uniref:Holliday junction resolvase RuvX n=1 Tax=Pyruvatibacter sp. HU-CL02332 TaxID=3127650 RepID=UPI003109F63D